MKHLLLIFTPFLLFAQQKEDYNYVQGQELLMTRKANINNQVDGSPYIEKKFAQTSVTGASTTYLMRYNAFDDEIEYLQDGNIMYVHRNPERKFQFKDLDKTYVFRTYHTGNGISTEGYLVELINNPGKFSLFKREQVIKKDGLEGLNSYQSSKNPFYERQKDIYLILHNNKYYEMPNSSRKLSQYYRNMFEDYSKTNKMKFDEEGFIQFVKYLNSLNK